MTPDEIAEIQEWLLILEARDLELPEFHAMQLKVAKATHVMLDRIAALEAVRDEWCAEARLLAGKLIERDAECTAERERREAAEAALRQVSLSAAWNSGAQEMARAHFARYKD